MQWSLLLAVAAMAGYLIQRHTGLPKVLGYSLVGTAAGLAGFSGAVWPLRGIGLFLLELGIALVLFECGGASLLQWFRHNPMVLVQSICRVGPDLLCPCMGAAVAGSAPRWPGRWPWWPGCFARRADARGGRHPRRQTGDGTRHRAGHVVHAVRADAGLRLAPSR